MQLRYSTWQGQTKGLSRHATLFFEKIAICSCEKPGWPGYRYLGRKKRDLGNRMKISPYEHSSPVTGTKLFRQNSFAFAESGRFAPSPFRPRSSVSPQVKVVSPQVYPGPGPRPSQSRFAPSVPRPGTQAKSKFRPNLLSFRPNFKVVSFK